MNPSRQNDLYRLPEGKHSHPSFFRLPWAVLLFVFFLGCATVPPLPKEPVKEEAPPPALPPSAEQVTAKDPFEAFPAKYRAKAIALEQKENWRRALFYWQVVSRLRPDDQESAEKIKTLEARIRSEAEKHFLKGLEHYQKKSLPAARQEFLIVLAYNPDYPQALEYLKYKLNETDLIFYETKEGDTLRKIAGATYHDPDKDFLVAYFNDLPSSDKLKSGLTLRLPILESAAATVAAARPVSSDEMLTKARALLKAKKYDQAVRYAEKILEYTPANSEANDLKNASYYQLGTRLLQKKNYRESLRMFKKVDITYQNVRVMIATLEKHLQDQRAQAENHYQKGVRHFLAEELNLAIQEWKKTLQLDPQHLKAQKDIEQANRLQEKLRKIH